VELWSVLVPILLADVLNPVLLGALIYTLGSSRPLLLSSSLLLGHTATYLGAGIVLALGIDSIADRLANPKPVDFAVEAVAGLALLAIGIAMARGRKAEERRGEEEMQELGLPGAFATGSIINLIGIPFAVPYFGAIAQMLKADLSVTGTLALLAAYNALYALPFAVVIGARAVFGERADGPLRRLNAAMERGSAVLVPLLLLAIGAFFLADAAWYLLRGEPLVAL
jgi:cytochrome c biogenesis protein CcdA